jgi:hypothetical protein
MNRTEKTIYDLVKKYLSSNEQNYQESNEVVGIFWLLFKKIFAELNIKKKYGVDIDFLNSDFRRLDLEKLESSYWFDGEIDKERPPGPTNSEIKKLMTEIHQVIVKHERRIREKSDDLFISLLDLEQEISDLVRKTFCIPNANLPFTKGFYDRNPISHFQYKQNSPCEICGESRAIDICHIIPSELGGPKTHPNIIYLCPTHHRLFDRFMLAEEEWDKLDWNKRGKASANFAYYVIRPEMEKFWKQLNNGDFQKRTNNCNIIDPEKLSKRYLDTIYKLILDHKEINIKEIEQHSGIKKSD